MVQPIRKIYIPPDAAKNVVGARRFLHRQGIEPSMIQKDDDGDEFITFSIPEYWGINKRREFNLNINQQHDGGRKTCESCYNSMWAHAEHVTVDDKDWFVCDECILLNEQTCK